MSSKKSPKKRTRHAAGSGGVSAAFFALSKSIALALLPTLAVGALLLVLTAALLLCTKNPVRTEKVAGIVLLMLTALCGGAFATRFYGKRAPLLCGICFSAVFAALVLLCSAVLPLPQADAAGKGGKAALFALLIAASVCGALFAARRPKKRRSKR